MKEEEERKNMKKMSLVILQCCFFYAINSLWLSTDTGVVSYSVNLTLNVSQSFSVMRYLKPTLPQPVFFMPAYHDPTEDNQLHDVKKKCILNRFRVYRECLMLRDTV